MLSPTDSESLLRLLLREQVLRFGQFQTKSGRISPYFFNFGAINRAQDLAILGHYFATVINGLLPSTSKQVCLFGPAYKGISLAIASADALSKLRPGLDVHFCFNRKEAKNHGEGGSLIGFVPQKDSTLILIDDVLTGGTSLRENLVLLAKMQLKPTFSLVCIDRQEKGSREISARQELEQDFACSLHSLVELDWIVQALFNKELDGKIYIDEFCMTQISGYQKLYKVK
ncbi:MAG: orotate phosphoribosyltransferase [Oligoflexales bacterium]|nr:orotate phosphoribosyltransferase [Oligoflexales bacterium]